MSVAAIEPAPSKVRKGKTVAEAGKARTRGADAAAPVNESVLDEDAAFFAMITRLPVGTPAENIERLFSLYQSRQADRARRAFDLAMIAMAPKLPTLVEHGKTATGSYTKFEDFVDAVRPILAEFGFVLTHRVEANDKTVRVTAILAHRGGHREENPLVLPHDATDGKSAIHAAKSSSSYGRRITGLSILGLATRGEDDDGKAATASQELEMISPEQKLEVLQLIASTGADLPKLLAMMKLESLDDVASAKVALLKAEIRNAARQTAKAPAQ